MRWAIVASGTRNALAISAVVRPPTARRVSASCDGADSDGWQHRNSSVSVSSSVRLTRSLRPSDPHRASRSVSSRRRRALSLRHSSTSRRDATVTSQARGLSGKPRAATAARRRAAPPGRRPRRRRTARSGGRARRGPAARARAAGPRCAGRLASRAPGGPSMTWRTSIGPSMKATTRAAISTRAPRRRRRRSSSRPGTPSTRRTARRSRPRDRCRRSGRSWPGSGRRAPRRRPARRTRPGPRSTLPMNSIISLIHSVDAHLHHASPGRRTS